jgi:hypothetical protein
MAKLTINIGTVPNDGTGDTIRQSFNKTNLNFTEIYDSLGLSATPSGNSGIAEWDTAYSWGDHATVGYLTSEADPVFAASPASGITSLDISQWTDAYNWGDHSAAGYINTTQDVVPAINNLYDLGSPTNQWRSLYLSANTIFIGDTSISVDTSGNLFVNGNQINGGGANTGDITFEGVKILGSGTASGDGNGYSTIELVPDTDLYNNDQYLIIDPTEPQHIHIRAGGTQDASIAELYLGGESNFVRVTDSSGVRLQNRTRNNTFYNFVDPTDFNTATWFQSDGTNFVQYTAVNAEIGDLAFTFGDDNENTVTVTLANSETYTLTYDSSSSNLGGGVYRFSVVEAPPVSPSTITDMEFEIWTNRTNSVNLSSNDFSVTVTDDIRIEAADTFSLRNVSRDEPIEIRTDYDNDDYIWAFNANGTLTFPDETLQSTAYPGPQTSLEGNVTGSVFADANTVLVDADTRSFFYNPTNPSDWSNTAPVTIGEAIDRLAAIVKTLNGGTGS